MARWGSFTSGRPIEIWLEPARWISGSDTPSESVRLRMVFRASSIAWGVTFGTFGVGRPSYTSSVPPLRSSPSLVGFVRITAAAPARTTRTRPRIDRLRVRLLIARRSLRCQHEQQSAVVVVGGEDVGFGRFGTIALGVHHHRLVEHPHSPLERGPDVVVPGLELEAQDLRHRSPDHVQVAEPRELAGTAAGP